MTSRLAIRLPAGGGTKTLDIEEPVTDKSLMRAIETQWPDLWAKCYPRVYEDDRLGGYYSPRLLSGHLAANVIGRALALHSPETGSVQSSAYDYLWACHLAKFGVPLFFLSRPLAEAIEQTKPPVAIEWHDMHLPYESAAFMMPKGVLTHPAEGDCMYVSYARFKEKELHDGSLVSKDKYGVLNGGLLVHAGVANMRQFHYHWPYTPHHADPEQLSFKVIHLGDLEGAMSKGGDDTSNFFFPEGMTDEDHLFVRKVAHYVFSTIMLMLARPELVERGALQKRVQKPGKPAREFWTPNVIGGRYRIARERAAAAGMGGSHASPRAHWRRGHWRQQAYGEARSLRRDQWIEPVLVNAGE